LPFSKIFKSFSSKKAKAFTDFKGLLRKFIESLKIKLLKLKTALR